MATSVAGEGARSVFRTRPGCTAAGADGGLGHRAALPAAGAGPLHRCSSSCRSARRRGTASTTGTAYGAPTNFVGLANFEQLFANRGLPSRLHQQPADHRRLAGHPVAAGAGDGGAARRSRARRRHLPDDLLPALHPRRRRRRPDLALHVSTGNTASSPSSRGLFGATPLSPARRSGHRHLRRPGGHRLEVFRLPHDALHRRACSRSTAHLYEAAHIDGATGWQRFRCITVAAPRRR